jgi:glyoxylase-like metal-dependent hydrolase (beta-lactamase superfamily II)
VPNAKLNLAVVVSAPFEENTYLAQLDGRDDCLIFDPGFQPQEIIQWVEERGLTPAAILCTHGHSDHIAGNATLKQRWPDCPLVIGEGDAAALTDPQLNLSGQFGLPLVSPAADATLAEGEIYEAAGLRLETRVVAGHSPGHVVFIWRDHEPMYVFGGDVLFQGSIGRTDFPNGSFEQLAAGIHQKLFTLPDDTIVLPGHGDPTTIGEEKRHNPFVGAPAGYRP